MVNKEEKMITKLKILSKNQSFMSYLKNSSWMVAEYILRIFSGVLVSIYIARFLGPEQFGILSYALAIVAIFMVFSRLGMDSVLLRDLIKHPDKKQAYLSTAFILMLGASLISLIFLSALVFFFESDDYNKIYIWIIATGLIFQIFLVLDYSFQSQVKAKYSSIAKTLALVTGSLLKIYLVLIQADLVLFAIAFAVDHLLIAIMLIIFALGQRLHSFTYEFDSKLVKPLLSSAWPMVLSGATTILYMRVDQVMIKNMLDAHQLGLYSAASKVYEGWIIVPYIICMSLMPAIVKLKAINQYQYEVNISRLYAFVFWPGILIAIITTFVDDWVIQIIFGDAFQGSGHVLSILMWTAGFASLGFVSARYLSVENLERKIVYRTTLALLINIFLNWLFLPLYGIEGAAISTLISVFVANYILDFFDTDLRQQLSMKTFALTGYKIKES